MTCGDSIKKTLESKKKIEGWEGWKVPVLLLHSVIEKSIAQGLDYVVFAVEGKSNGKKRPDEGRLLILGMSMDTAVRNAHLKANPKPLPEDPPGQIDQFPPW